jgi:transcriptional regulator with XRE-family HTH domain
MESAHSLDGWLRASLLGLGDFNQSEFARRAGVLQSWLNRYMNGIGSANLDEAIRLIAVLQGAQANPLSERDVKMMRLWAGLSQDQQDDLIETMRRFRRRAERQGSAEPAAQTPPVKADKARGKWRVVEG